jgi:hypothetical protein
LKTIPKFERLFHLAADVDVDKDDLRRYGEFLNANIYDLLVRAQGPARANGRDIIQPYDLPITAGLRQCIFDFRELNEQVDVQPILDQLTYRPPLDFALSAETEAQLAEIAGGITVALARAFKLLDPNMRNPHNEQWERVTRLFELLL